MSVPSKETSEPLCNSGADILDQFSCRKTRVKDDSNEIWRASSNFKWKHSPLIPIEVPDSRYHLYIWIVLEQLSPPSPHSMKWQAASWEEVTVKNVETNFYQLSDVYFVLEFFIHFFFSNSWKLFCQILTVTIISLQL